LLEEDGELWIGAVFYTHYNLTLGAVFFSLICWCSKDLTLASKEGESIKLERSLERNLNKIFD